MTRLLIDPAADFDDPGAVTITATLLDPGPSVVRTFADVTTDTVVDLPAPDTTEAWRLTIRRPVTIVNRWNIPSTNPGPIVAERTVHFPDGDPVAWAALTDVDPGTLRTTTVPGPAWDAAIAELRAEVDNLPAGGSSGSDEPVGLSPATQAHLAATYATKTPPPASLLLSAAPSSPATLAGDDFTGTAGASLDGRASDLGAASTWAVVSGIWRLDDAGHLSPTTATDGVLAVLPLPGNVPPTSYSVRVDVVIGATGGASNVGALVFRYTDPGNFWYFQPPVLGGNDWSVYRVVGGTHTQVLQFSLHKDAGSTVRLRVDLWGRQITLNVDGVEIYSLTDPTGAGAATVGLRQGITGGYPDPCVFSAFTVTAYAGAKFNIPRVDTAPSTQVVTHGGPGTWDNADANNPNVVWDPVNSRWGLYWSGYDATATSTIQGMGLAYSPTLDGTFVKDPGNPVVPATAGNVENGGLIWAAGRWLRVEDLGKWYTSPDLHTWTEVHPFGLPGTVGDPFLRVNGNGLVELWYGIGIPATGIGLAVSADGGLSWDVQPAVLTIPAWLGARGHGEPSVYVPPGREGVEAMIFVDLLVNNEGRGGIAAAVTVDGGDTWHWHEVARGSGTGFDAFQVFDSFPVFDAGVFYLFHSASPVVGGEVNLDCSIGRRAVQWTPFPLVDQEPVPYQ